MSGRRPLSGSPPKPAPLPAPLPAPSSPPTTLPRSAIERWLTQNSQPLWGHERPTTFVWLAAQTGSVTGSVTGTIVTADDTSEIGHRALADAEQPAAVGP